MNFVIKRATSSESAVSCSLRKYLQAWRIHQSYLQKLEEAERLSGKAQDCVQEIESLRAKLRIAEGGISALREEETYFESEHVNQRTALEAKGSLHAQVNNGTAQFYQNIIYKLQQAYDVVRTPVEHDGLDHCQTVTEAHSRLSIVKKILDCFEKLKESLLAMAGKH